MMIGPFCILLNTNEVEFRSARPSPQAGCGYRVVEIISLPRQAAHDQSSRKTRLELFQRRPRGRLPAENLLMAHALPR